MRLHGEVGARPVGERQLRPRRHGLERRDRGVAISVGLRRVAKEPGEPRKPGKCLTLLQTLAESAPDLECRLLCLEALAVGTGQVTLVAQLLLKSRSPREGKAVGVAQRRPIMRGCFTMGSEPCRLPCRKPAGAP